MAKPNIEKWYWQYWKLQILKKFFNVMKNIYDINSQYSNSLYYNYKNYFSIQLLVILIIVSCISILEIIEK